jgi:two-component system chemotaxis response regulator CheY
MTRVDSQPHRLVVCDDDATVRQIVGILATQAGYEIAGEAATALEAEALVAYVKPHVLVLDIALTGMSGLDVIDSLRTAAPETTIIVFTAFDTMGGLADRAGAFAIVRKDEPGKLEDALLRARAASRAVLP